MSECDISFPPDVTAIETLPGDDLSAVIKTALAMVADGGMKVGFAANGVRIVVVEGDTFEMIEAEMHRQWNAQVAAYRASPEGIRAKHEEHQRLSNAVLTHAACMAALPMICGKARIDEPELMDWLATYADAANHGDVHKDYGRVLELLGKAGYAPCRYEGLDQSEYDKPNIMAGYIIGQAMDCMQGGMPPHPVTISFIEKYRALLASLGAPPATNLLEGPKG